MNEIMTTVRDFNDEKISNFNTPFVKEKIDKIEIEIGTRLFRKNEGVACDATIRFVNGDSRGSQKIEAKTLDECIKKIKAFIDTL